MTVGGPALSTAMACGCGDREEMKRAVRAGSDFFHCGCGCCGRFCALMSLLVLAELNFVVFGVGGDIRTLVPSKFEAEDDRNAILIFFLSLLLLLSGSGQQATATSDISNLISSSIIFISLASCFLTYFIWANVQ